MQATIDVPVIGVDDDAPVYGIGDAARAVGRSPTTIRLWERLNRIQPARRNQRTGERMYSKADIQKLCAFVASETAAPAGADGNSVSEQVRERLHRLRRWGERSRSTPPAAVQREAELIT